MEAITGHIKERVEHISGEIKEYCDQDPVLVKDSAGTLLYTKNSGETATITDSAIKDTAGTTLHSVKAQASQTIGNTLIKDSAGNLLHTVLAEGAVTTIPDVVVKNSENTVLATIKAESAPTTIDDITVTNPITGVTYAYPAKKNLTESVYKEISLFFKATYDDIQEYTISEKSAATYTQNDLVNCTVVYEINNVAATLPFSPVNTNVVKAAITRTNPALDASVTIKTS